MKIRNGFVSNSSSSSFIVIFPKIPKSAEDVKNILFTEGQTIYNSPYDFDGYSLEQVAETVWNDIKEQKVNDMKVASETMENVSHYDYSDAPNYKDFEHIEDLNERWEAENDARTIYAKKKLKEFFNIRKLKLKKLKGEDIGEDVCFYNFEYADNDGSYFSALEHGDLFRNLKHIKISNH